MANTAGVYIKTNTGLVPAATVPGPPGSQGATGGQGPTGATGSLWYTGTGAPATGTGVVNDFYLDNASGDVYKKTATSTWTLQGNIKGLAGDLMPIAAGPLGGSYTVVSAMLPSTRTFTLTSNLTLSIGTGFPTDKAGTITLIFKQPATGGPYSVTWPTLEWPNDAAAPAMPTVASSELMVHLFWTGSSWRAVVGGIFYP